MSEIEIIDAQIIVDDLHDREVRYLVRAGGALTLHLDTPGGYIEPRVRQVVLAESGAIAHITGTFVGHNNDTLDLQLDTIHSAPHTIGRTDFRAVLSDQATFVFRGMIEIKSGAQQSQDFLRQDTLMLSSDAKNDSIPSLEISANDVRASHGVTARPIDLDQMFYLQSRGVPATVAVQMLIDAFLDPVRNRTGGVEC